MRAPQSRLLPTSLLISLLTLGACGGDRAATTDSIGADRGNAMATPAQPDTTADRLWAHLEASNYRQWPMWPGKSALYSGTEPHGARLTTYVNTLAQDAITSGAGMLPGGAIIVKENYMPDSTLAAITVMYKARGYDAAHNDWFWLKRLANGTVEASGRVDGCIGCHGQKSANDYIMTAALK